MDKIAIVVLNWKQAQLSIETIESILKTEAKNHVFHIFLIDNGSPDTSLKQFHNKFNKNKNISILNTGDNLGYVGGNNFGIKAALEQNFDWVLLINNDVLVDKNFLNQLIDATKKDKNLKILGPKIYFAPGHEYHKDRYQKKDLGKVIWSVGGDIDWKNIMGSNAGIDQVDHGQFNQTKNNLDFISGCCILIKSDVFTKIGFLDEKYFMYLEDADFCIRAKLSGYKNAYIPTSIIWHINAGSSSSGSELHNYFLTRNRLLFGYRYATPRTKFALFRESIKIVLFSKSIWQKKGIMDYYFNKLGKGSWK